VECAAAILIDTISAITFEWIADIGLKEGNIIRVQIDCHLENEAGTSFSSSCLSNLSLNRKLLPTTERVLFVSREREIGILGYGSCVKATSLQEVRSFPSSPDIFFVGGEAFDQEDSTKLRAWLVPLVELRFETRKLEHHLHSSVTAAGTQSSLAINFCIPPINDNIMTKKLREAMDLLQHIQWDFSSRLPSLCNLPPLVGKMEDTGMSESRYLSAVQDATAEMQKGDLQKVVYALRKTGTTGCIIDAAAYLHAVANGNKSDEGKRYTFLFAPNGLSEEVFISLSPEQLCRVEGSRVVTEALAGTYPRGFIDLGGSALDDKTNREHSTVSDFIANKLSALGGKVCFEHKHLLQMKEVVHHRQILSATSPNGGLAGIALLDWAVKTLHPTPAVCGLPIEIASEKIKKNEQFSRGLYSSYCGILSSDCGELLVGLRSAIVHRKVVHVFAGAGLVLGSVPTAEWREIELKMSQYVRVLESIKRPAMSREFHNATAAVAAMVIEEMIRQGVGAFCVCPGARSTPFAVAIHRNSVACAMAQVVHDERAAGFYALGCARAGVLCAVLVTSGTAVSNLLPAVSEARESSLPMVLITADRPSESRDVGEAQTIRQVGIFSGIVEYEKDFPPPCSEAPLLAANLATSILSDISFGVGEIAVRRSQRVHLNFQFRKPELDPVVVDAAFPMRFSASLHPKVDRWLLSTSPYTCHITGNSFFNKSNDILHRMQRWVEREWRCWSVVLVVGEIRSMKDAIDLRWMSESLRIPCICDTMSMMAPSSSQIGDETVFLGVDRLFNAPLLLETLTASTRLVIRIGGSMISTRTLDWMSKLPLATVVRVRDDGFEGCRHDSTWISDQYVHMAIGEFAKTLVKTLRSGEKPLMTGSSNICSALHVLRMANAASAEVVHTLASQGFSEPQIAMVVQQESDGISPVFLSSSMACRDYDGFAGICSEAVGPNSSGFRRIACNRGANGIDGVVSSAAGFAHACASESRPVTVLIGDVATLHDISGISIAAGVSPGHRGPLGVFGGGRVGKIVCVNNSGGAIFSFLPAAAHRNDFFSPFLDTPHTLDLSAIAASLSGGSPSLKCVRVTSAAELRAALRAPDVFFIECFGLPSHVDNVAVHKMLSNQVVNAVDTKLVQCAYDEIEWTLHSQATKANSCEGPFLVLLHGWMGNRADWSGVLNQLRSSGVDGSSGLPSDVLTVCSGGNVLCPSVFCRALRKLIREELRISREILIVGYSQGGRLGMHYRSLFPSDVHALITLSTCPGKQASAAFERCVLDMWSESKALWKGDVDATRRFLETWYALPVFSDMPRRMPREFSLLLSQRSHESSVDLQLRNMACIAATSDAVVDLMLVGDLDSKYLTLAAQGMGDRLRVLPNCGHNILYEAPPDRVVDSIKSFCTPLSLSLVPPIEKILRFKIKVITFEPFEVPMKVSLVVLSQGLEQSFPTRRGYRIHLTIIEVCEEQSEIFESREVVGFGEIYEPVFSILDRNTATEVTYESMSLEVQAVISRLEGGIFTTPASAEGISAVLQKADFSQVSAPVAYGFQQSVLIAVSQLVGCSLLDAIGAVLGKTQRCSHVSINGFASVRSGQESKTSPPSSSPSTSPSPPSTSSPPLPLLPHGSAQVQRSTQILKLKVGDPHGVCCLSDALRVNSLVAESQLQPVKAQGRWLRLDANQSWSIEQAVTFGDALTLQAVEAIEYVEEPLRFDSNISHSVIDSKSRGACYDEMRQRCVNWRSLTITLDESLVQLEEDFSEEILRGVADSSRTPERWHAVVKPSLLSLDCRYLRLEGGQVTISCTFESGLGLAFLVCVSCFFEGSHGVHAKGDMAEVDSTTREYTSLLHERGRAPSGGMTVRVSKAVDMLMSYVHTCSAAGVKENSF
jgi:2-succinyl-5-enolpyruvyl-6-hydroxy-3-cyclohexene-1-carboxylate synthase